MPDDEAAEETAPDVGDVETSEAPSEPADESETEDAAQVQEDEPAGEEPAEEAQPAAETPTVDEGPAESGGWPWDIAADPDSAPPLAALDESGEDSESMIRAMADDDASRTVVLGEYAIDDVKGSEPFLDAAKRAAADESAAEQAPEPEPESVADSSDGGSGNWPCGGRARRRGRCHARRCTRGVRLRGPRGGDAGSACQGVRARRHRHGRHDLRRLCLRRHVSQQGRARAGHLRLVPVEIGAARRMAERPTHTYPFTAIVGQESLKTALVLNAIDPRVGGVLVRGEKGTAKSTAVRALASLLPEIVVVEGCSYGCDPADPSALCDQCAKRLADGELPHVTVRPRVVDLPVSATEDRVVGTLDFETALREGARAFHPGLLAEANRSILYVDEVNLLDDHLVDTLLDAAAMGVNVVEREGVSVTSSRSLHPRGDDEPRGGGAATAVARPVRAVR